MLKLFQPSKYWLALPSSGLTQPASRQSPILWVSSHVQSWGTHRLDIVSQSSNQSVFTSLVTMLIENIQCLDSDALTSDQELCVELLHEVGSNGIALGIVLVSPKQSCQLCSAPLILKADRPSKITIYTDCIGTIGGTHFWKICKPFRSGCPFVQHYGHYSTGVQMYFDHDWHTLPYFLTTR